jgi:DNA repair photolyase
MALNWVKNKKSNMYQFIDATWNTIKGECFHDCSYCYMKRWGKLKPVRFDEKELKTDLGTGNFIFVGSSCDMFAENIPDEWIKKTLKHMEKFDSKYLLQTKNPTRVLDFIDACVITDKCVICTTIESNRDLLEIKRNSPDVFKRAMAMNELSQIIDTYVTIEPIMDFDMDIMVQLIKDCNAKQINIGADSGRNNLPEPSKEKVLQLVSELQKFTIIHNKSNLQRLL